MKSDEGKESKVSKEGEEKRGKARTETKAMKSEEKRGKAMKREDGKEKR